MMYDHWGWMGFGGIWMLLFLGLAVLGIVAIIKYVSAAPDNKHARASTALQVLEERYARGEIDRSEFEQKKHDLGG